MTLVDISGTVPGSAKFTSAVKGPCLKKPIVPASVRHCIVRVGVVFVTVELVNVVKVAYLHVEQRLTNRQGDLSMQLVTTKQVRQKTVEKYIRHWRTQEVCRYFKLAFTHLPSYSS